MLENFQINIIDQLDGSYIKYQFKNENIEFSLMVFKVSNGHNPNEVAIVPKNQKIKVFLKNFFNYLVSIVFYGNISCFLIL